MAGKVDKKKKKYTAKETAAIQYYTNPGSNTVNNWCGSYKQAGYSTGFNGWKVHANRVLHKSYIEAEISRVQAQQARSMDVTKEEIITALRKLSGLDTGSDKLNNAERLRALELLGRYKAMFTDNVSQTGQGLSIKVTGKPKTGPKAGAKAEPKAEPKAELKLA